MRNAEQILKQLRKENPPYEDLSDEDKAVEKLSNGPLWQDYQESFKEDYEPIAMHDDDEGELDYLFKSEPHD